MLKWDSAETRNSAETAFPQNLYTRKSGEITVFFAVLDLWVAKDFKKIDLGFTSVVFLEKL